MSGGVYKQIDGWIDSKLKRFHVINIGIVMLGGAAATGGWGGG